MRVWLCDLTYDQQVIAADTMPTNIGYLASFAQDQTDFEINFNLFKYPSKLTKAIDNKNLPDVIGFSNFIWNSSLNLSFAKKLRQLKKNIIIIFGGLEYPQDDDKKKAFLKLKENIIDFYIYKEGETAFLNLLMLFKNYNFEINKIKKDHEVVGVHYVRPSGEVFLSSPAMRIRNLVDIPSPFTTGLLDEFFDENLMPVLTTNRGCPFTCTFCAEGNKYYSKVNKSNLDRVRGELEYIANKIVNSSKRLRRDIYISDSNFGMFKEDIKIAEIFAECQKKFKWPDYIIATTGKNHKTRVIEVSEKLEGNLRLSGSVQSLDPQVQKNIKRENIDADMLMMLAKEAGKTGANTYSEIILGLPGDSLLGHKSSLEKVINSKYDYVLAWQLVVLKGTEIESKETREQFGLKTKFRALTKSYGNYSFKDGSDISVSEIEEIVVAGNDMSIDDYYDARILHLIINIFYNDNFFKTFLKVLDLNNIERFDWVINVLSEANKNSNLSNLINRYKEETKNELWDNKEELENHLSNKKVIKKFLSGEYGANLLAKYRIMAISKFMKDLAEVAKLATFMSLSNQTKIFNQVNTLEFLDEVEKFEYLKKKSFFVSKLEDETTFFKFDVKGFLEKFDNDNVNGFNFSLSKNINFYRSKQAQEMILKNTELFGTTYAGIYKQLTRTNINRLYRKTSYL